MVSISFILYFSDVISYDISCKDDAPHEGTVISGTILEATETVTGFAPTSLLMTSM